MKTKKLTLLSLAMACAVSVSGLFACNALSASAAEATTYKASALFSSEGSMELKAENNADLKFSFEESSGAVQYNRDLAYKWFTGKGEAKYLSLSFRFEDLSFKTFTLTFQSAENNITDKKTTENKIVFKKESSSVKVVFVDHTGEESAEQDFAVTAGSSVTVALSAGTMTGEYGVSVSSGSAVATGAFTNVFGSYAEADVNLVPLAFSAEAEEGKKVEVSLLSLNGQTFALNETGEVVDNAAPVLAINGDIKNFTIGTKLLNFTYEAVDVCESNVTKNMKFYKYDPETVSTVNVETLDNYSALTSSTIVYDGAVMENENAEYVSIAFSLSDKANAETNYQVSWYVGDPTDIVTKSGIDFMKVIFDENCPEYTCINIDDTNKTQTFNSASPAYTQYVAAVKEAAKDIKAGEGYKFYLPSLEDLIVDDETPYSGLTFTIYYKSDANSTVSTVSSLAYNKLAIPVSSAGRYTFKVVAMDKSYNEMYFWQGGYSQSITTSNIFDEEHCVIPSFSFYVENTGITIENVVKGAVGTVGKNYTVGDFNYKGVSGYNTEFELFYLENLGVGAITYDDFIALVNENNGKDSFTEEALLSALKAKTGIQDISLRAIKESDTNGPQSEDDEGWDVHDNRYSWRPASKSFTPGEIGYYVVKVELSDKSMPGTHLKAYKVIYVSSETDEGYGDTYWIENNVVTIVFASIAGVSAVALLVVWIAFPNKKKSASVKKEDK